MTKLLRNWRREIEALWKYGDSGALTLFLCLCFIDGYLFGLVACEVIRASLS